MTLPTRAAPEPRKSAVSQPPEKGVAFASRIARFSAASSFCNPDLLTALESQQHFGKAANPNGLGHDYTVEITVTGPVHPDGMITNLAHVKKVLEEEVIGPLHCCFLNQDVEFFRTHLPTRENITAYLWNRIEPRLEPGVVLDRLTLTEGYDTIVTRRRKLPTMMEVTRRYDFCASHRLHSKDLSDEENKQVYGKCNHINGHGHNYELEVTVRGEPDPRLGTVIHGAQMDEIIHHTIIDRVDHRNFNMDIKELQDVIPTTENVVRFIWEALKPEFGSFPAKLHKIRLSETPRNHFEYTEENE